MTGPGKLARLCTLGSLLLAMLAATPSWAVISDSGMLTFPAAAADATACSATSAR